MLKFKNNVPFRLCISRNNNTLIYNAEDLDIAISTFNLEQKKNYSVILHSL